MVSVSNAVSQAEEGRLSPRHRIDRRQSTVIPGAGPLACLDSLAAGAALLLVLVSVNLPRMPGGVDTFLSTRISVKNVLLLLLLLTSWPVVFHLFRLYEARVLRTFQSEAGRLVAATTIGACIAAVFPLTTVSGALTLGHLPQFWLAATVLCLLVRIGRRAVVRVHQRQPRRTLIVGTGRLAEGVWRDIVDDPASCCEVVGFLDLPESGTLPTVRARKQTLGTLDGLEQILMREVIDEVVIALPVKSCYQQIQHTIAVCERAGVEAKYGVDLFESTVAFPRYHDNGDRAFVAMQVTPDGHRLVIKRVIDIFFSVLALVVLAPVMALVALAVKLTSPGPVIYPQSRYGYNKRPFRMYKFRSMYADAESLQQALEERNEAKGPVFKIRNDPRVTPLGRWLRRSSLDELPQLWNVLRGDMSLVGPRPLPDRDVHRISRPSDMRRFSMRPGITCLWQVQGRSNVDFDRWVALDLEYIDTWSLTLDFRLLARTIPAVLTGNGAS
jgi:exopolysaccharide biosynthesis polyprenyl glycosylphosphotransferase